MLFLVLAIMCFARLFVAKGCVNYQYPDNTSNNTNVAVCDDLKYSCDEGFVMEIKATCMNGMWYNQPICVNLSPPVPGCTSKLDVVFVIDGSSSVGDAPFYQMTKTLTDALPSMNIGPKSVHVAAVVFSKYIFDKIYLIGDLPQLKKAFSYLSYPTRGGTYTDKGIIAGMDIFEKDGRDGVERTMVVLTDGASNDNADTVSAAQKAKDDGIKMYAVGIGNGINESELTEIASSPDNVFLAKDFAAFQTSLKSVTDELCAS